jgi:hypothetical protein
MNNLRRGAVPEPSRGRAMWRIRTGLAVLAIVMLFGSVRAFAEETPLRGVVELFTSQGCKSCPPADEVLGELATRKDVIALAYHVDYWDYLGWRDTLGRPENTQRQQDYGKAFKIRTVYTPQAVVNGRSHVNGAKRSKVNMLVDTLARSGSGLVVSLKVWRSGESVFIDAGPGPGKGKAHLVLVHFDGPRQVEIGRGDNAGKVMTYVNAVTDVQTAGMWHGKATRFELPASEIAKKGGCVALLQAADHAGLPGPILGAVVIRQPDPPELPQPELAQ